MAIEQKTERLSNTSLAQFKKSPLHYLYYKANKTEPTEAMLFGKAFHHFVLQNESFADNYFTLDMDNRPEPTMTMASKANKSWKELLITENAGKQLLTTDDLSTINEMYASLQNHEPAMDLFCQLSDTEKMIEWIDPDTGLALIGFIDGQGNRFKIDFKVVQNASSEQFVKEAFNKELPRQAALYTDATIVNGGEMEDFYFIPIERNPPYGISVQKCSHQFINHGRLQYATLLADFVNWNEAGRPITGYEWKSKQGYFDLNLPAWLSK